MLLTDIPLETFPPQAIPLAAGVFLMIRPRGRFEGMSTPAWQPPFASIDVETAAGPIQIVATRWSPDDIAELAEPEIDGLPHAFGSAPVITDADVLELAEALDPASRLRLLNLLLSFCKKAFDLANDGDFASTCLALVGLAFPQGGSASPVAAVTRHWTVLQGLAASEDAACWSIGPNHVRRLTVLGLGDESTLRIVDSVDAGDVVVALGQRPTMWTIGSRQDGFRDLIQLKPDTDVLRNACLKALAPRCPIVAATLRERAILSPAKAIRHDDFRRPIAGALEAAIPDNEGKIFLRGWLHDPLGLVASADLCGLAGNTAIALTDLHRFHRPDLAKRLADAPIASPGAKLGFVALVDDPAAGMSLQPTLVLRLLSGAQIALRPALQLPSAAEARAAVLTSVSPANVTATMLEACIAPAAAAFHRRSLMNRGTPEIVQLGKPVAAPLTSILIPLYRNLSFLRFQLAAFACDRSMQDVEFICILDSPEQRQEAEHLLRGLHAMHDLSILLLVMPRNLGYAAANNAGASIARAPTLLLLNSDIVPEKPGWLTTLRNALDGPGVGAVGPKLLFDDESVQHAGLFFQRDLDGKWLNAHFHKGMPRHWPAADRAREVPGLTGAAILVRTELYKAVGGICEDYIIGDYEDSDFCLRIRQLDYKLMYVPDAELFHFERRSIEMHRGYAGTLACQYNRQLHHQRWDQTIDRLMTAQAEIAPDFVEAA